MPPLADFSGRVAIVTGAARGLGGRPRRASASAARVSRSTCATAGAPRRSPTRSANEHSRFPATSRHRASRGDRASHPRAIRPSGHPGEQRGARALDALRRALRRRVARGARGESHRALSAHEGRAAGDEGAAVRPHHQHLVVRRPDGQHARRRALHRVQGRPARPDARRREGAGQVRHHGQRRVSRE